MAIFQPFSGASEQRMRQLLLQMKCGVQIVMLNTSSFSVDSEGCVDGGRLFDSLRAGLQITCLVFSRIEAPCELNFDAVCIFEAQRC